MASDLRSLGRRIVSVGTLLLAGACAPATPPSAAPAPAPDVVFLRDMIAHHEQALVMSALVPERSTRADLRTLAERIARTQQDEIARMSRWLETRDASAHAHPATHAAMPGMLSAEELAGLEQARGVEFERRFLELMIRHHQGALTMAAQLLAAPVTLAPDLYRLVNDIDADQRAENARMQKLLAAGG